MRRRQLYDVRNSYNKRYVCVCTSLVSPLCLLAFGQRGLVVVYEFVQRARGLLFVLYLLLLSDPLKRLCAPYTTCDVCYFFACQLHVSLNHVRQRIARGGNTGSLLTPLCVQAAL